MPAAVSAFSPAELSFLPAALVAYSSELKQVALFGCLGHPPSEEALLGKKGEDWFPSIHESFLGLVKNVIAAQPAAQVGAPAGL